ncbi:MAG TPA: Sec-independent protein translocase protein TatB [Acidimicrobiales bacterium]|jgi:sec-independent protein translocase protein TatB|nr:Sec-independent protein translocase protein TatB [Acidimicrobiales bacterium]
MFNIGPGELVAILAVALIVLGPNRLPEAVRTVGRVVGELRRISSGFQDELRNAFDDNDVIDQLETKPLDPDKPTTTAIDTAAVGLSGATVSTEPLDGSESEDDDDVLDDDTLDGLDLLDDHDDAVLEPQPHTDDPPDTDQRAAS